MASISKSGGVSDGTYGRSLSLGLLRNNPLFVTAMGLCPALAVSYRVDNAIALGGAVFAILVLSSLSLAAIGERVPRRYRFVIELLVASSLATVADLLFKAYAPQLSARLGIYVPLIAVNCMVLAGSERVRSGKGTGKSLLTGVGDGLGFFFALLVISIVREVLGSGTITLFPVGSFDGVLRLSGIENHPISIVGYSVGALLVLGYLQGLSVWLASRVRKGRES